MLNGTNAAIYEMAPPPAQVVTVNTNAGPGGQYRFTWLCHPTGANASFVDGHVETCSAGRLFWMPLANNAQTHTANYLHGMFAYFDYQGHLHQTLPANVPPPTF